MDAACCKSNMCWAQASIQICVIRLRSADGRHQADAHDRTPRAGPASLSCRRRRDWLAGGPLARARPPSGRGLPDRRRDAGRAADRFDDVGQVEGDQCAPQMGGERLGGLRLVA